MAKLTKAEVAQHNKIKDLLYSDKALTWDEKEFMLEHYHEGATSINSEAGAFFTPHGLARDFTLDVGGGKLIDMCAGIGKLSFWKLTYDQYQKTIKDLICVELNPQYVELGKRIVPEATWIQGDVLSVDLPDDFDWAYSNPPFGNIKTSEWSGKYKGSNFEYKVIERASQIAKNGSFILPSGSCNFKYSGAHYFDWIERPKYKTFNKQTGIEFHAGVGIDTSVYKNDWKGVSVICESVVCYFNGDE